MHKIILCVLQSCIPPHIFIYFQYLKGGHTGPATATYYSQVAIIDNIYNTVYSVAVDSFLNDICRTEEVGV